MGQHAQIYLKVQLGKYPNFMKYFKTYHIKVCIMKAFHITLQSHYENGHKSSARCPIYK